MANLELDGGIKIYLREIGKTALLTPEQEVELAGKIKKGSKSARDHMIKANLRLVVKIARDYENYGLPLLDLISEAWSAHPQPEGSRMEALRECLALDTATGFGAPAVGGLGEIDMFEAGFELRQLRRKLADSGLNIRNVRGLGYMLETDSA